MTFHAIILLALLLSLAGFKDAWDNGFDVEADAWILVSALCGIAGFSLFRI